MTPCPQETGLGSKNPKAQIKGSGKIYHANSNPKRARMSIIMSGKTDVNNPLALSGIYKALKLTADLGITANTSPKSQRLKTIQMAMTWMDTSKVIHSYNRILLSNKR